MPPKKNQVSAKTEKKIQNKVIEDKTFGLKNKNKSKTVQKYIKGVEQQVKNKGISEVKAKELEFQKKQAEKEEEEKQALLASLYKSVEVINQREAAAGEDPKSIICAYYKQGLCQKGRKCKFSHDLDVEFKAAKIDIYTDQRDIIFSNNDEDMTTWDTNKLQEVVSTNQKKYAQQKPTEIICKYFLDAVENSTYGWRWVCPNGWACHYRHCLPPGYTLKKDKAKREDDYELTPLEELLEEERAKLSVTGGTPVTLERFMKWKEDRRKKKEEEAERKQKEEEKKAKKHGHTFGMSGRALFKYDPTLFKDDDEADEGEDYANREDQDYDEEKPRNVQAEERKEEESGEENENGEEEEDGAIEEEEDENGENEDQEDQNEEQPEEEEKKEEEAPKVASAEGEVPFH
eukprot:TRINITY_DN7375_c0_g1_i10.p1 TRINITY_DN7375_c0_g1~~TRINITY_DN7375_c0_g1_i10.p1  ORF type:complete len:403 (-),score=174.52 TRINITY_DN7375_c0_g1_i10:943-2151(-)